ncbi:MAG: serine hydrolase [Blastocatellia bacterium]|nr:serine hydrolase [Blastocatellia bacterium]
MKSSKTLFTAAIVVIALAASQAYAIIVRHDRKDADYLRLAERYPSVGFVGRDGEGTLIAPQWVLTAAHVASGIPQSARHVEFEGVKYRVEQILIHPDWSGRGPHDIALLKLVEPVKAVKPVSIYTATDEAGQVITFVGRGDTGTGLTGPKIQDRKKRAATNKVERADQQWLYFTFDDPATATDLEGISGPGDSGGPALIEKDGKTYTLGVSVWGRPGKNGRGTYGAKEGYARVSSYHEWITAALSGKAEPSTPNAANVRVKTQAAAQSNETAKFPDTESGRRVAAYIEAFNSGSDSSLRRVFANHFSKSAPARFTDEEHLQSYRRLYNELGKLELRRVAQSSDELIAAVFRTANGMNARFEFSLEPAPPHKLTGIGIQITDGDDDLPDAGGGGGSPMTEAEAMAALDDYLKEEVNKDEFSGAALVAKDGKPIYRKAYGLANKQYNAPNHVDTKFNLGSINKIFTQIAIAQLIEQGKLSVDDTIIKRLTDYPNRQAAERVTVQHLLDHTSGIGDIFNDKYASMPKSRLRTIADYLLLFADEALAFEPGSKQQYSNGGYIVLGAIIEKVSGQSYYDYVREHIYKPASMADTDAYEVDASVPNLASGYTRERGEAGKRRSNLYRMPARGSSAGGGYSTTGDMLKFTIALQNCNLLSRPYTEWLLDGMRGKPPARSAVEKDGPLTQGNMGIAGGAPGINSMLELDFETGYTVIVMSNYDPPTAVRVARQIRAWLARVKR